MGLVPAVLLALLTLPHLSTGWQERATDAIQGEGAAGVNEVGRPLDVLRTRAERLARQRAIEDLVLKIRTNQEAGEKEDPDDTLSAKIRSRATSKEAFWQVHYWTNGAVTATVTIRTADLLKTEGESPRAKE